MYIFVCTVVIRVLHFPRLSQNVSLSPSCPFVRFLSMSLLFPRVFDLFVAWDIYIYIWHALILVGSVH